MEREGYPGGSRSRKIVYRGGDGDAPVIASEGLGASLGPVGQAVALNRTDSCGPPPINSCMTELVSF